MPRTVDEIQSFLRERIAEALNRPASGIRVHVEVSRLGLDSIKAARISGQLSEFLGHPVDATLLWDHPTIASAAEHVARDQEPTP